MHWHAINPNTQPPQADDFMSINILVLVVLALFLRLKVAMWVIVGIPITFLGALWLMPHGPWPTTINTISLFGFIVVLGIVVDDAIVVVENVQRHMADGLNPRDATKKAMTEVTAPVIATTLVLLAVFVPTAFTPGITGRLFVQFAATISIAVTLSSINALTLSPALCATLLRPPKKVERGPLAWFEKGERWIEQARELMNGPGE